MALPYGSHAQEGERIYYPRRTPHDSELDINKTIAEQWNLIRACDNEAYPSFFIINGNKYTLKRIKMKPTDRVLIRTARHERIRNWLWIAGCIIAFAAGIVLMQIIQYWKLIHHVGWRYE